MSKVDSDILWKFEAPTFYDFTKTEEENNHLGDSWFDQSNNPIHSTLLEFKRNQQQKDERQDLKINYEEKSNNMKIDDPFLNHQQQQQQPFNYTNDVYIHSPTHRIAPTKQRRDMKSEILRYNENTNDSPQKIRRDNNDDNDINLGSEYSSISNDVILEPSTTMIKPSIDLMTVLLQNKYHDEEINKKRKKEIQMEVDHINNEIYNDLDLNEKDEHDNKKRKLIPTNQNSTEIKEKEVKEKEEDDQHYQPIGKTLTQVLASVATYSAIIKKNHSSSFSHPPLSPLRIRSIKSSSTSSSSSTTMFTSPQQPQSLPLLQPTYRMESVLQRAKRVLQESHIKSKLWNTSDSFYDNNHHHNHHHHFDLKQSLSSLRIMKQPKVINQRQSILLNRKTSYVTSSTTKSVPEIDYLENKEEKNNYDNDNGDSDADELLQYNLLEDDNDSEENDMQPSFFSYWSTPYLPINLTKPRSPKFQTDKRSRYYR